MKELVKRILSPLRKFIQYLFRQDLYIDFWKLSPYKTSLVMLYEEKMMETSLDYALKNFRNCLRYYDLRLLRDYAMNQTKENNAVQEGLLLEFGTWQGESINHFSAKLPAETFYGFDSFIGLKENWSGHSFAKGHFSLQGVLPKVNPNVKLIKGWFDETLPNFLLQHKQKLKFLHVDCDTYESTVTIMDLLTDRIVPGTLILFDEYIGYPSWEIGEYKAFQEFILKTKHRYEYLGFSNQSVFVRIK
jgi:hypothetical protein